MTCSTACATAANIWALLVKMNYRYTPPFYVETSNSPTPFSLFVFQNSTRPPLKLSNVERITNFQILVLFGCLLAISLVCSFGQTIWKYQYGNDAWYMDLNCKSPESPGCSSYSTYFVTLVHIGFFRLHFKFSSAAMCSVVLCCFFF